jgi:hypothetical protein
MVRERIDSWLQRGVTWPFTEKLALFRHRTVAITIRPSEDLAQAVAESALHLRLLGSTTH